MPDQANKTPAGRLAFRHEGAMWNAYWMPERDSPKGQELLGSIHMCLATDPDTHRAFLDLMREAFGRMTGRATGGTLTFDPPIPAPPHEKAGHA